MCFFFFVSFFFNDTATTEIYTLSLHDALPISASVRACTPVSACSCTTSLPSRCWPRSEEHTSDPQSRETLVCRLLLEKKKTRRQVRGDADMEKSAGIRSTRLSGR